MSGADEAEVTRQALVARLDLPWESMPAFVDVDDAPMIMHRVYDDDRHVIAECSSPEVAEAIAEWSRLAALGPPPERAALDRVLALCDLMEHWGGASAENAQRIRRVIAGGES